MSDHGDNCTTCGKPVCEDEHDGMIFTAGHWNVGVCHGHAKPQPTADALSRSVQRRVAAQKDEPMPTFEPTGATGLTTHWLPGEYGGAVAVYLAYDVDALLAEERAKHAAALAALDAERAALEARVSEQSSEIARLNAKFPCGHRAADWDDSYGGCVACSAITAMHESDAQAQRIAELEPLANIGRLAVEKDLASKALIANASGANCGFPEDCECPTHSRWWEAITAHRAAINTYLAAQAGKEE